MQLKYEFKVKISLIVALVGTIITGAVCCITDNNLIWAPVSFFTQAVPLIISMYLIALSLPSSKEDWKELNKNQNDTN